MKLNFSLLFLFFPLLFVLAQDGAVWNTYQAKQEKGVSSTNVRMDLIDQAPVNGFDFLFYVKIDYRVTKESDFPIGNKLKKLYQVKDDIFDAINKSANNYYVGSFMYDGNRFEYYYIQDASGLEAKIDKLFAKKYSRETYKVFVREDISWELYKDFLYPNDEIKNFMSNRDTLIQLRNAGDVAEHARKIEHYAKFPTEEGRKLFIAKIKELSYTIDYEKTIDDKSQPYEVKFHREDTTSMERISKITQELMKFAYEHYGTYDGWETFIWTKK
ncbi:DUF695 domain-containing protein [uncultured Kordia sp.]|uniref:DUF695 domain-containing protein n=1 Tax=uncultured Kordia sp. TaxID=507699 RepID=UPI0026169E22|nr:DUF695 domain-containing protein [uncultured Kordia sp.]